MQNKKLTPQNKWELKQKSMSSDAAEAKPELSTFQDLISRLKSQWFFLRISIEERLVYRGDFALGTLMRFLPIITQIFLWGAVFQSVGSVAGYSQDEVIAYYLLTMVSRAFSSMPGLASGIAEEIRSGTIKRFIIQPVDMVTILFWSRVAHKLVYYLIAIGPFAFVFFLCRSYFPGWPDLGTFALYVSTLILGFILGFLLESTIGMIAFWFLEVSSLLFVYMLFSFFLSGHMFPLDMLPESIRWLVVIQPLQFLAYFPAAVFLGKVSGSELVTGYSLLIFWVVFFFVLNRVMFKMGLKRYSAFGG